MYTYTYRAVDCSPSPQSGTTWNFLLLLRIRLVTGPGTLKQRVVESTIDDPPHSISASVTELAGPSPTAETGKPGTTETLVQLQVEIGEYLRPAVVLR